MMMAMGPVRWVLVACVIADASALAQPAPDAAPAPDSSQPAESTDPTPPPAPPPPPPPPPPAQPAPPAVTAAPEPEKYPLAITDRPLVRPPGVTALVFGLSHETRVQTSTDAMGVMTKERKSGVDMLLSVSHAFGPVELGLTLAGAFASAWVHLDTHMIPGEFAFTASFLLPQADGRYAYVQSISVRHKVLIEPHRFAVWAAAFLSLSERGELDAMKMLIRGYSISTSGRVLGELQLTRRLGLYAGAFAGTPIQQTEGFSGRATLGVTMQLLFAFTKWDIFLTGELGDITRAPSTSVGLGFEKRWGL